MGVGRVQNKTSFVFFCVWSDSSNKKNIQKKRENDTIDIMTKKYR